MKTQMSMIALLACFLCIPPTAAAADTALEKAPQQYAAAFFPESTHEFEPVVEGTKVTHDYIIQNKGDAALNLERIKTG